MQNCFEILPLSALGGAFPNLTDSPVGSHQCANCRSITFLILAYLLPPKVGPAFWPLEEVAIVPMPKAAVDKDHCSVTRKNEVWLAR